MSNKKPFDICQHKWKFHIDADSSGGPINKPWQSFYICEHCNQCITLTEKCMLDQTFAQNESLKIQEKHTQIGMWANIVSSVTLIVAVLTLIFGDKLIK